jgi:hypothetical protein
VSSELHKGPLGPSPAPVAPAPVSPAQPLTWREKRWRRRHRRRRIEELMGWIMVPLILLGGYWLLTVTLAAMGTTPTALIEGVKVALQGLEKR